MFRAHDRDDKLRCQSPDQVTMTSSTTSADDRNRVLSCVGGGGASAVAANHSSAAPANHLTAGAVLFCVQPHFGLSIPTGVLVAPANATAASVWTNGIWWLCRSSRDFRNVKSQSCMMVWYVLVKYYMSGLEMGCPFLNVLHCNVSVETVGLVGILELMDLFREKWRRFLSVKSRTMIC